MANFLFALGRYAIVVIAFLACAQPAGAQQLTLETALGDLQSVLSDPATRIRMPCKPAPPLSGPPMATPPIDYLATGLAVNCPSGFSGPGRREFEYSRGTATVEKKAGEQMVDVEFPGCFTIPFCHLEVFAGERSQTFANAWIYLQANAAELARRPELVAKASGADPGGNSAYDNARRYFTGFMNTQPRFYACVPGFGFKPATSYELTRTHLTVICDNGARRSLPFANTDLFWWFGSNGDAICMGYDRDACQRYDVGRSMMFLVTDQTRRELVTAFLAYRQGPAPMDPASDAEFQAALQRAAGVGGDQSEARRRAQLVAQALLEAGRTTEAADEYRKTLAQMPNWPAGHYNLALISGQSGQYGEAITEMRRYLYLAPNAEDARAAQDQIYKWEALLPR